MSVTHTSPPAAFFAVPAVAPVMTTSAVTPSTVTATSTVALR